MLFRTIYLFLILLLCFACSKETIIEDDQSNRSFLNPVAKYYSNWQADLSSTDGILVFKSMDHLSTTKEELILKSYAEVRQLEDELDFRSQQTTLNEIILAEEHLTDAFYAPYTHLTDEEIYALNLEEPKSEVYKKALAKGLLTVEEDSRDAHVYQLSVIDPTNARILNDDGFVMVADTLWQYTDSQIKFCTNCSIENKERLADAIISNEEQGIVTFTINNFFRNENNWDGNLNKGWTGVESKRRARYERHGYSVMADNCNSHCYFLIVKYYLHNEAQRKRWGKWKYRSSYTPWFRWDGHWSGHGNFHYCTNNPYAPSSLYTYEIQLNQFNTSLGVVPSPMNNRRYSGNNNTDVTLHPHSDGMWYAPPIYFPPYFTATKCWRHSLEVYFISIDGKIIHSYSNPSPKKDLPDG